MKFLQQAEATERAEHDRAAAEARGPAPEPARSFRLPQQLIPDLLVLWELLQTLAPTLQVCPPQHCCISSYAQGLPKGVIGTAATACSMLPGLPEFVDHLKSDALAT